MKPCPDRMISNAGKWLLILVLLASIHLPVPWVLIAQDCGDGGCGGGYTVVGEIDEPEPQCPQGMPDTAQYWYDPANRPQGLGPTTWEVNAGSIILLYVVDTFWPPPYTSRPPGYGQAIPFPDGSGWSLDWLAFSDLYAPDPWNPVYHVLVVAPSATSIKSRDELCETWEDGFRD